VKDQTITTMKDLSVTLSNDRPGELAKAVTAIGNMQVNIEGFCQVEGKFHCVTNDPKNARKALETVGLTVTEHDILVFTADDRPGYLANVLRSIAEQEVNVIASYTLTNTRIALSVSDAARAKEILEGRTQPAQRR
jgi:hypothetical protein